MENPINYNYLYCMNINCKVAIYNKIMLRIPCDACNGDIAYRCDFCNQKLTSDNEIMAGYMITAANNHATMHLDFMSN